MVTVAMVDLNENPALAQSYGVQNLPTGKLFKGGQVQFKHNDLNYFYSLRQALDHYSVG